VRCCDDDTQAVEDVVAVMAAKVVLVAGDVDVDVVVIVVVVMVEVVAFVCIQSGVASLYSRPYSSLLNQTELDTGFARTQIKHPFGHQELVNVRNFLAVSLAACSQKDQLSILCEPAGQTLVPAMPSTQSELLTVVAVVVVVVRVVIVAFACIQSGVASLYSSPYSCLLNQTELDTGFARSQIKHPFGIQELVNVAKVLAVSLAACSQ
jgi:hypothetical protein